MKKSRDRGFALTGIIIACIITAIAVGGGVYTIQKVKVGNLEREMNTLRSQINENQTDNDDDLNVVAQSKQELDVVKNELNRLKVLIKAKGWGNGSVENVWVDPGNKDKFYFATYINMSFSGDPKSSFTNGNSNHVIHQIWSYDLAKDSLYQRLGIIDLQTSKLLFEEKFDNPLGAMNFILDINNGKIIFKQFVMSEGGRYPCFSWWLESPLYYINLVDSKQTKKEYTVPQEIKNEADKRIKACEKTQQGEMEAYPKIGIDF